MQKITEGEKASSSVDSRLRISGMTDEKASPSEAKLYHTVQGDLNWVQWIGDVNL